MSWRSLVLGLFSVVGCAGDGAPQVAEPAVVVAPSPEPANAAIASPAVDEAVANNGDTKTPSEGRLPAPVAVDVAADVRISPAKAIAECSMFKDGGGFSDATVGGMGMSSFEGRWALAGRKVSVTGEMTVTRGVVVDEELVPATSDPAPFSWSLDVAHAWSDGDGVAFAGRDGDRWVIRRCDGGDNAFSVSADEDGEWVELRDAGGGAAQVEAAASVLRPNGLVVVAGAATTPRAGVVEVLAGRGGDALAEQAAAALRDRFATVTVSAWPDASSPVVVVVGSF